MRTFLIALLVVAPLAACGGGDDGDTAEGSSTTSTTAVGLTSTTAPPTGDPAATTGSTAPPGPAIPVDTTPIDPATVETLPPAPDPGPTDPGFPPPEPGQYTFQTTGTNSISGPTNGPTVTTVTSTGPNEVRHASAEQILDLQYRADGAYVRQLVARFGGMSVTFQSPDGVLFATNPHEAGRQWDWRLTDTNGGLTAAWHATALPPRPITAAGTEVETNVVDATITLSGTYSGFPVSGTMRLVLWIDPARRLPVQIQQTTTITQPLAANAESTSTFTGFAPA